MYKIAAFIEFDKKIERKILKQKKRVKKLFGNQKYLNHPVHLTLFTLKIQKISDLKKIYKKIVISNKNKSLKVHFNKAGVFINDPLTQGHTIFYNIKKNKKLCSIQINHLKKINKKINVLKHDFNLLKISILRRNYKKYGFPFAGNIWIPHVTIASLKDIKSDHKFIKNFLKSKINLKCQINELKFYKIVKDKHTFLFSTKYI